jgi:hypothetical protein
MADGTMVMIDKTDAYRRFRDAAAAEGFAKAPPEDREIFDQITITTANDSAKPKKLFDITTEPNDETKRSNEPQIYYGQNIPNDLALCFHSIALECDQLATVTGVQHQALLRALANSVVKVTGNSDVLFSRRGSGIMTGLPGSNAYLDANAVQFKTALERSAPYAWPVPRAMSEKGSLKIDLLLPTFSGAPTTFDIKVIFGVWVARKGQPSTNTSALMRAAL